MIHSRILKWTVNTMALILLIWGNGCKSPAISQLPALAPLPDSFAARHDSVLTIFNYKHIFTDHRLRALIDTALKNNLDLKEGLQRINIAAADAKLSRVALYPNLNAVFSAGVDRYGSYTMNGVGNFDTNLSSNIEADQKIPDPTPDYFIGFRSSWEVDIWGKLKKGREAAGLRLLATQKGQQWYTMQVVAAVASLYVQLVTLDKQKEILERNIQLQKRGLEIVEAQMAGGRATSLAVKQMKAQVYNTQSAAFLLTQEITVTQNRINNLSGRYPVMVSRDTSLLNETIPESVSVGLPSSILLRRPDVHQAELELQASKAQVIAARKAFLPSLSINMYAALNAFKFPLVFSAGSMVGGVLGGLTAPVLNRSALENNFSKADAGQMMAYYNYQRTILQAFHETVTELSAVDNFSNALRVKSAEVNELSEAVSTANDLYLAGYATYLEVIIAQARLLDAEIEQVNLKRQSFEALINLYKALGG